MAVCNANLGTARNAVTEKVAQLQAALSAEQGEHAAAIASLEAAAHAKVSKCSYFECGAHCSYPMQWMVDGLNGKSMDLDSHRLLVCFYKVQQETPTGLKARVLDASAAGAGAAGSAGEGQEQLCGADRSTDGPPPGAPGVPGTVLQMPGTGQPCHVSKSEWLCAGCGAILDKYGCPSTFH